MNKEFFTTQELAEKWKVTESTIRNLCNNGELGFTKIGNQFRFTNEDIELYLEKNKNK